MATVGDTISGALRKIGVLAAGRQPRTADQADTLATLQGMYRQWISNGTFGRLRDVVPLTSYIASPNERVYRNSYAVTTITLPELVRGVWWVWDPSRGPGLYQQEQTAYPINGVGAVRYDVTTPRDASIIVINDSPSKTTAEFVYDGHIKEWRSIAGLTLADEAPFSYRDPKGLESVLALQIVDEFAGQVGQMTVGMARQFMSSLNMRYSSPAVGVVGVYY